MKKLESSLFLTTISNQWSLCNIMDNLYFNTNLNEPKPNNPRPNNYFDRINGLNNVTTISYFTVLKFIYFFFYKK